MNTIVDRGLLFTLSHCTLGQIKRLQPHVPLLTINDNIITKGIGAFIKQLMEQQIEKWTVYKPTISTKELKPEFNQLPANKV